MKIISYGGGVQSTAMIVLAVQGLIPDVEAALFANVGDDSEHPDTLEYVRNIAVPWAAERGLPIHELSPMRKGQETTLFREITQEGSRRDLIPVFGEQGNPMGRACTADFKIKTLHRWLRENGATKTNPAYVQLGISTDEIERAGRGKDASMERRQYPLLDLGMNRTDCMEVIRQAGLPVPPKSSCFFCPFHSELVWSELRRDRPDLFDQAQYLEDFIQQRKRDSGMRQVYITRKGSQQGTRLSETIYAQGDTLFGSEIGADGCDSGYCWT
jgi:hypothetical protein